jgi:hypothetical protein
MIEVGSAAQKTRNRTEIAGALFVS